MRHLWVVCFIAICFSNVTFSQSHILPCNSNNNDHHTSICWGYATGRAFFKKVGDVACDPSNLYQGTINPTYFIWVSGQNLVGCAPGNIIGWGSQGLTHVAFVEEGTTIESPPGSGVYYHPFILSQVRNEDASVDPELSYAEVKSQQGGANPTGYWKKIEGIEDRDITVKNQFNAGSGAGSDGGAFLWGNNGSQWVQGSSPSVNPWDHSFRYYLQAKTGQFFSGREQGFTNWDHGVVVDPLTIHFTVSFTETYRAMFANMYNIELQSPNFVEQGSGGTYKVNGQSVGNSWTGTALQNGITTVEALPPGGWIALGWSNGVLNNPYQLPLNQDVLGLKQTYKAHRGSSLSTVTASNTQRKVMSNWNGSEYDLVYASGGEIWWTQ